MNYKNNKFIALLPMINETNNIAPARDIVSVSSWSEAIYKLRLWMVKYAEETKLRRFVGAFFFIEDKNEGTQFVMFRNKDGVTYLPNSFRFIHLGLIYNNGKIDRYVGEQTGSE